MILDRPGPQDEIEDDGDTRPNPESEPEETPRQGVLEIALSVWFDRGLRGRHDGAEPGGALQHSKLSRACRAMVDGFVKD